jgi:hypothetical protein
MFNKMYKFVMVLMGMLLVLSLASAACTLKTPTAHELTYTAKTYTNSEYGFSFQYPSYWVEHPEFIKQDVVAAFGKVGNVPVPGANLLVDNAAEPLTADWIIAANNARPDISETKVTSDITPTTLYDGTPAYQLNLSYTYDGQYAIDAFGTIVDKEGNRIWAVVWTIEEASHYDETLFSEIAHTLSIK